MIKILLLLSVLNISLFAEMLPEENSMPWLIPWLGSSLLLIGVCFWGIYKAMKTKNPKYGYLIFLSLFLMAGLLFV